MSLTLYFHPLSSFCQKVTMAFYEADISFKGEIIDLGDAQSAAKLEAVWPMLKFPVLRDEARGLTIPESTSIIEYLAERYEAAAPLVPGDPDLRREARLLDRIFDGFINQQMQKIVGDRLRPEGRTDAFGVDQARQTLIKAYGVLEDRLSGRRWAAGDEFTIADCAAAPSLFYADRVAPFSTDYPGVAQYFDRLKARPSYERARKEAEPYFHLFPERVRRENRE